MPPCDPCAASDGGVRTAGGRENTRHVCARRGEEGHFFLGGLFPRPFTLTEKFLLFSLIVLLVCDVATTTYAVGAGIGYEGNPVMTGVTGCPPLHLLLKLAYAGAVVGLGGVADRCLAGAGVYCIGAACAFYVLPLVNNLRVIATCSPV